MPSSWPPWKIAAERKKSRGRRVGTRIRQGWKRDVYRAFCSNPKCRMPYECARKQDAFEPDTLCPSCSDGRKHRGVKREEEAEFRCGLIRRERQATTPTTRSTP